MPHRLTQKFCALGLLALLSLLGPVIEILATGRLEPFGKFELAETFLAIPLVYWWYHLDKRQRHYEAGPLMNAGVIALTVVALPVYFVRSRGWKRGMLASGAALLVLAITWGLGELGEKIGVKFDVFWRPASSARPPGCRSRALRPSSRLRGGALSSRTARGSSGSP